MTTISLTAHQRAGTAAALADENPVLDARELCLELDTGRCKLGDGATLYNDLRYLPFGSEPCQAIIADVDADVGTFTMVDPIDKNGVSLLGPLPRSSAPVGMPVLIPTGSHAGVWLLTASGPMIPVPVFGNQMVAVYGNSLFVATNGGGDIGFPDPLLPAVSFTLLNPDPPAQPHRYNGYLFALHDGNLTMDGVGDFIQVDGGAQVITDGGQYDGLPVYRLAGGVTTIDDQVIGSTPNTVIGLTNQTTSANNGFWELFHDSHGVTGVYLVRTQILNGSFALTTDLATSSGLQYLLSGSLLYVALGTRFAGCVATTLQDGGLTNLAAAGSVAEFAHYTPGDPTVWATPPTTVAAALDKIAAVLGDPTPIP